MVARVLAIQPSRGLPKSEQNANSWGSASSRVGSFGLMAPNSSSSAARQAWASKAAVNVDNLLKVALVLNPPSEKLLDSEQQDVRVAIHSVLRDCDRALRWLDSTSTPRGCGTAAAELRSAANVLRNAAWLARKQCGQAILASGVLGATVRALVIQGQEHAALAREAIPSN